MKLYLRFKKISEQYLIDNPIAQLTASWLHATPMQKLMRVPYFLMAMIAYYLIFFLFELIRNSPYIDRTQVWYMIVFDLFFLIVFALIILFRNQLTNSKAKEKLMSIILPTLYLTLMFYYGHSIGLLSAATGVVMGGVPLLLFSMLERKIVYTICGLGLSIYILFNYLIYSDVLPYAPVFKPEVLADDQFALYYIEITAMGLFPHLMLFILLSIQIVNIWRQREQRIHYLSTTDGLLKISNRRAITSELQQVLDRRMSAAGSTQTNVAVILCDIDYFKRVNDEHGHQVGDNVLMEVIECIQRSLRTGDKVGRYGGEEFLITLHNADISIAKVVAERCRKAIEALRIFSNSQQQYISVTASFGVYSPTEKDIPLEKIIHYADQRLYKAKDSGRNRVCAE